MKIAQKSQRELSTLRSSCGLSSLVYLFSRNSDVTISQKSM